MSDFFIARQPIFDRSLRLYAYELLFRGSQGSYDAGSFDDNAATAQVLTAGSEMGLGKLVGNHLAFINMPDRFILEPDLLPLPPTQLVLEILETVDVNSATLTGMRSLREQGFTLALDDFIYEQKYDAALALVDLVKLDIQLIEPSHWAGEINRLKQRGLKVLAEKVETEAEFERLSALGCDFFQGYFFARPNVVPGKRLSPNKLSLLSLLAEINDPATEPEHLAELVSRDLTLSMRALNYVNSVANGLHRRIDSVRDAVIFLGRNTIRNWVTLYLMFSVDGKPDELVTMALIRARFCERLAEESGHSDTGAFFTLGLLSVLDALMDERMERVLEHMAVSEDMRAALLHRTGAGGHALSAALAIERGDESGAQFENLPGPHIAALYIEAMHWADDTTSSVTGG